MRKQAKYTYQKINQDTAKTKHSNTFYWDAKNIRVITNDEFGAVTNQKGNELVVTIPALFSNPTTKPLTGVGFPISGHVAIHTEKIAEKVVIFTTTSTKFIEGVDCIWLLEETTTDNFDITLLYIDKLGFTNEANIESVGIDESEQSQKVYWVDGENEVRFINILDEDLINKPVSDISVTPTATLLDPNVTGYSPGGAHKSGVIQYAFSLYNKFGAETKVSGLSELVALYNGEDGSPLDAPVDKSPNVQITDIPQNFDYIKVYSIFYSSLGTVPRIALIYDNENSSETLEITDTNDIIQEVSLNEFNILGTQSIIPKHIASKDGHLFFGDYKTKKFDVDYDARAFSVKRTALNPGVDNTAIYEATIKHADETYQDKQIYFNSANPNSGPTGAFGIDTINDFLEDEHDCINDDPEAIWYYNDSGIGFIGARGKNVRVQVTYQSNGLDFIDDSTLSTSLKRGETYRIGVVFYNDKDEESFVKWITDIKIPDNTQSEYEPLVIGDNARLAKLSVELDNIPEEAVSYRLVKVKRLEKDKTVKLQGFLSPLIAEYTADEQDNLKFKVTKLFSDYVTRTLTNNTLTIPSTYSGTPPTLRGDKFNQLTGIIDPDDDSVGYSNDLLEEIHTDSINGPGYYISRFHYSIKSPDLWKKEIRLSQGDRINIIGALDIDTAFSKVEFYTSYDFKTVYGEPNKDDDLYDVSIEEPIEARIEFKSNNITDSLFSFQVDPATAGGNLNFISLFFNLEDNADDDNSIKLIAPRRAKFTFTKEDTTTVEVNDWEFKKIINNRKFKDFVVNNLTDGFVDIEVDEFSFSLDEINVKFTIDDVKYTIIAEAGDPIFTDNIEFNNFFKHDANKVSFTCETNKQLIFSSEQLGSKLASFYPSTSGMTSPLVLVEVSNPNITQYGGNTYADRQRNTYIPLSKKILSSTPFTGQIDGVYGDTYIQRQSYLANKQTTTATVDLEGTLDEVITYVGETYINNDLRYDRLENKSSTDSISFEDAFKYNEVYEQQSDLIKSIAKPFNFTEQEVFRSEVIASPKKILGELIDNWSKISINDRITLDTKYGEVTGFAKLNDTLYSFQRNAIAYLAIKPRVQLGTNDNIPIELGSGKLIERYQYVTTESGTLHSRSIEETESGVFYFDTLNYSINRLTRNKEEISLTKGLYNFIQDFTQENYDDLFPINRIVSHYDNKNEEVYFTFSGLGERSFTVAYNLLADGFVSFYDFMPTIYFNINNNMFTIPASSQIWEHDKGNYGVFYGTYYPSSITLLFNEDPDYDKIVDNLSYITNVTLDGEDQVNLTFNNIQVYNSYQDTGEVPLTIGSNIRRKFREFHVTLPREQGTRNRIRGEYALIKLDFNYPSDNYKLVLNDSIVTYTIS